MANSSDAVAADADSCAVSTRESLSCSTVPDEQGKVWKECVRAREIVRHCLGRPAEVVESHTETTREELPFSSGEPLGRSWGRSGAPSSGLTWGPDGTGSSSSSDGEFRTRDPFFGSWNTRGVPFGAHAPGGSAREDVEFDDSRSATRALEREGQVASLWPLDELLARAEMSVRAALGQLGHEIEEFRPFGGFHQLFKFGGPEGSVWPGPRSQGVGGGSEGSQGQGDSTDRQRDGFPFIPRAAQQQRRRKFYDDLSRDFEEV